MSSTTLDIERLKFLKKKKIELLKEKRRRQGITPLNNIREHDKQLLLTLSSHVDRWFFGGNRTGKTEWGAHECARFLHKRHPVIPLRGDLYHKKNIEGWAGCPSYDLQEDTTQPKLLELLDPDRILDTQKLRGNILLKLVYKADDGTKSTLHFKSYEQGRTKFQGAGKDFMWFDEEAPKDVYDEARMRSKAGMPFYFFCTMTPVNGMTWVYDDIYQNTLNQNLKVVTATWEDNIFLTEEQKSQMASSYTADALEVRRMGRFVQRTGLVMSWFRREINLMDANKLLNMIPKGCDVYCGIDFGYSKPCAVVYVAIDSDDNHYIFDGFYKKGLTTPQIAQLMKRKEESIKAMGLVMRQRYGDSANPSDIKEISSDPHNLPVSPVKKAVGESQEGWDEFRSRLMDQRGRVSPVTGKSKILVSDALVEMDEQKQVEYNWFLKEAENLRWDDVKRDGVRTQVPRWSDKTRKDAIDAYSYIEVSYAAPPEDPIAAQRRRAKEYAAEGDSLEDSGWAAYIANEFGFLLPPAYG